MTDMDRRDDGIRRYEDSAWEALDHIEAVRAEGRRYRPARLYDRPQLSERPAGKPKCPHRAKRFDERQRDLFE